MLKYEGDMHNLQVRKAPFGAEPNILPYAIASTIGNGIGATHAKTRHDSDLRPAGH
jgi:hypothetical protein